ncbi:MAG TPA: ABC transporter permease [bacterium]|nr:ABC transporter permease [bacterium]
MPTSIRASALSSGAGRRRTVSRGIATTLRPVRRSPGMMVGGLLLLVMVAGAVAAPVLVRYDPIALNPTDRMLPPEARHLLGTDEFGRDVLTRILFGGRISLRTGAVAVSLAIAIGVPMGLLSGFYGGLVDRGVMRLVDIMLTFPGILLALVIVAILGPSLFNAMLAVGISASPTYARVIRAAVLTAKPLTYVEAARAIGCRNGRIVLLHILPNVVAPIIVLGTLGVAGAILAGAALSFLGLGAQPPQPEWGALLSEGRNFLLDAWWIATFPGLAIMVTVLAINLLGDGLRDLLDPQLR